MIALPRFDGRFNMAEDARLLAEAEAGKTGWRVYGWDGPWVSLGHYQDPARDLLGPELVPWVMRPTGGKAVLHGHDVTVGLAMSLELLAGWNEKSRALGASEVVESRRSKVESNTLPPNLGRSLKAVYRLAIQPILEAMRACGVPAVLGEEWKVEGRRIGDERETPSPQDGRFERGLDLQPSTFDLPRSSDCFAVVSPNDVVDARTGLKVCGCALKLTQTAVLVQASLPARTPLVDPRAVFARPAVLASSPWDSEDFPEAFAAAMDARSAVSAVR